MATFWRKVHKRIFERVIGRVFLENQEDSLKTARWPRTAIRAFSQHANERGWTLPWVYTRQECLEFWSGLGNASDNTNRPEFYARKEDTIIHFLHSFWAGCVGPDSRVLELGCNAGSNLEYLRRLGYRKLGGVEINANAVRQLGVSFPELQAAARVLTGSFDRVLPTLESASADVVFIMGVGMHIHPKDNFVFSEMARVSSRYICTIEPEVANSNYVFARNYRRVFERLGCRQVRSVLYDQASDRDADQSYNGCMLRLFEKQ